MIVDYLIIFFAVFCIDVIWTIYIRAVAQGKALKAALLSGTVYALSVFSFINIVDDWMLLIPAVAGAILGTYVTIKWETRNV